MIGGPISALNWWNEHRNSPGMDAPSRRCLLTELRKWKTEHDGIRDGMTQQVHLDQWDEVFAEDTQRVNTAIEEITESLPENQPVS